MLQRALVAHKDLLKLDDKVGVVYSMKCNTCDEEYAGETGRKMSTRMKEHKSSVLRNNMKSTLGKLILKNIGHKCENNRL